MSFFAFVIPSVVVIVTLADFMIFGWPTWRRSKLDFARAEMLRGRRFASILSTPNGYFGKHGSLLTAFHFSFHPGHSSRIQFSIPRFTALSRELSAAWLNTTEDDRKQFNRLIAEFEPNRDEKATQ